jgi:hypothetical protein
LATTVWVPTASTEPPRTLTEATPAVLSGSVTSGEPSTTNVTVPVGVLPAPVTVAVYITAWPNTDGFALDVSTTDEGSKSSCATADDAVAKDTPSTATINTGTATTRLTRRHPSDLNSPFIRSTP